MEAKLTRTKSLIKQTYPNASCDNGCFKFQFDGIHGCQRK